MIMMRHSVNNNTPMGLVIFLSSNSNNLISLIPPTASDFRHLLSCDTTEQCDYLILITSMIRGLSMYTVGILRNRKLYWDTIIYKYQYSKQVGEGAKAGVSNERFSAKFKL